MFKSQNTAADLINGTTFDIKDLNIWKSIKAYNIYAFFPHEESKKLNSEFKLYNKSEKYGYWKKIASVEDRQDDSLPKYEYKVDKIGVGSYMAFYVSAVGK